MWRLFIAEMNYSKSRAFIVTFFSALCFITIWFGVKWEQNRIFMPMLIMLVAVMAIVFIHQKDSMRTGQIRMHVNLPIALWRIGIIQSIYPVLFWFCILIIYFCLCFVISLFTVPFLDIPSVHQLLTMNGIILILNAFILLTRNINLLGIKRRILLRFLWVAALITAILPFYVITNTFGVFGENTPVHQMLIRLFQSPLIVNILGVCLYGTEYFLFLKRRSFLEY